MTILAEFGAIFCTWMGINYVVFRHIKNLDRAWYIKWIYKAISIVILPLLLIQTVNTLSGDFLGVKYDLRFCRISGTCVEEYAGPQREDSPKPNLKTADAVQICKRGLNSFNSGWSQELEFEPYVIEATRRGKSIDDCRAVLGLPTLAEEEERFRILVEENRLRSLDQAQLCSEAIDETNGNWDRSDVAQEAIRVAQDRGYTEHSCLQALGRSYPVAEGGSQAWPQSPDNVAPDFPTGYIWNVNASFANLRESPGNTSRVVTQLVNGTEVVLLGIKPSPKNGHAYCRVLTRGGVPGYVDHELVNGNCFLDSRQTSYLMEVERQEKMEVLRLFRDIAVIGLGLALTRK